MFTRVFLLRTIAPAICCGVAFIPTGAACADATSLTSLSFDPEAAKPAPDAKPAFVDPDAPISWTVQFEPAAWYSAPSGKVKLPVNSGTGPGSFTSEGDKVALSALDLDGSRMRPYGELHVNFKNWRITFSGADDSNERGSITATDTFRIGSVAVSPGDKLDVDFHLGTYELTVGYMFKRWDFQELSKDHQAAVPIVLSLYALGGVRLYDSGIGVKRLAVGSTTFAEARSDEFFGEPILGIRAEADFTRMFGIDVQLAGGAQPFGNHTSYSVDIAAGFHFRPWDNIAFQIGYRQLALGLSDGDGLDDFEYKGRVAGLFFGVDIRF